MVDDGVYEDGKRCERGFAYPSRLIRDDAPGKWLMDVSGCPEPLELATTAAQRLRGMLFRDPDEVTRLLVPCCDVHTFGMRHPLDIAFIAREGNVLEVHRKVGMRRRLKHKGAAMVAERFSRDGEWLHAGDMIHLGTPKKANRVRSGAFKAYSAIREGAA